MTTANHSRQPAEISSNGGSSGGAGIRTRTTFPAALRGVALSIAATCAAAAPASAHGRGCHTAACKERVAAKKCSQARPRWCVERAIVTYRLAGWQAAWMRRIPACESRWDPYARNPSGSSGLYQFLPSTWRTTPYGRHSIWSAKWQALAAAWMLRVGRAPGEWSCK